MPGLGTVLCQRENFGTFFGHQNRVLELSRQSAVDRSHGPTIMRIQLAALGPGIDHRFDGETHSWIKPVLARLPRGNVRNVGTLMEFSPDAVADVLFNNPKATEILLHVIHNRRSDD